MSITQHVQPPADLASLARAPRKWWLLARSPLALGRFRFLAAAALALHFAAHWLHTPSLFVWLTVEDLALAGSAAPAPAFLQAAAPPALSALFTLGSSLAVAVAAGFHARIAAALLYAVCLVTYRAVFPIADLDDYLAVITALFLALMPDTGAPALQGRSPRARALQPVSGLSTLVFLVFVVLLYVTSGFGHLASARAGVPAHLVTLCRLLPVTFVLPVPGLAAAGVLLQLALHAYLGVATPALFSHLLLAATALLFWGEPEQRAGRARRFDAGAVTALLLAFTTLLLVAASLLGQSAAFAPALRAFYDAGLLPPAADSARLGGTLSVRVSEVGAAAERSVRFPGSGRLAERFVARLASEPSRTKQLTLATALARGYCAQQGYMSQRGTLQLSDAGPARALADFECGAGGTLTGIR
jgi:hypothetical protein